MFLCLLCLSALVICVVPVSCVLVDDVVALVVVVVVVIVVLNCFGLCLEGSECGPGERTNE
jgi:hypothetical protein